MNNYGIVDDMTPEPIYSLLKRQYNPARATYVAFVIRTPGGVLHQLAGKTQLATAKPTPLFTRFRNNETAADAAVRAFGPHSLVQRLRAVELAWIDWVGQPAARLLVLAPETAVIVPVGTDFCVLRDEHCDGFGLTRTFWQVIGANGLDPSLPTRRVVVE